MLWEIELLYLVAMLATFIVLLIVGKTPSGIALMAAAVVGFVLSAIFSHTDLNIRHFIEGAFGYFDTILVIVCAMIFIKGLEKSGALDYLCALLVKAFKKVPTILLVVFMLILMLPGMVTGSSLAAVISIGAIVSPIMLKMGLPRTKVAAIVGFGAILGMVAPPINIPVMAICDVVDIPYTGFTTPLFALTLPLALFAVLFLSRAWKKGEGVEKKNWLETIILLSVLGVIEIVLIISTIVMNVKESANAELMIWLLIIYTIMIIALALILILGKSYSVELNLDEIGEAIDFNVLSELNFTVLIPLIIVVLLYVGQSIFPRIIGMLGTPLYFVIGFIFTTFLGRKHNVIFTLKDGIAKSISAMGLLMGVGMFVQVMTLNGVRGYFVINAISLPSIWQYVAIAVAVPVFGGISAFGSASILGGPFVMALLASNEIIVASALSLVAALGEFLPPTAMSATFAGKQVGEEKALKVTKSAVIPLAVCLIYALIFIIGVAAVWA